MATEKIDWVTKTKMVYSHAEKKEVEHKFLRWSLSDNYNHEMNDNDIADQYRLVYRCLRFMRNNKWWWAEFLYIWETTMVNSYIAMKQYYHAMGVTPRWTHWEFQESIAWALLDPGGPPQRKETSPEKAVKTQKPREPHGVAHGEKRRRLTENTLKPGALHGIRLDRSYYHFPSAVAPDKKKTTVCQMHRLANKVMNDSNNIPPGSRKNVMVCEDCGAALCLRCWRDFHTKEVFEIDDYCKIVSEYK